RDRDGRGDRQAGRDPRRSARRRGQGSRHRRGHRAGRAAGDARLSGGVLVTGGLGFIGGYVVRELAAAGREVAALTRGVSTSPDMQFLLRDAHFKTEIGTVGDLDALVELFERERPNAVVHSASNVEVAALFHDPYQAFRTNVTGALNVLEAARRTGVER